MFPLGRSVHFEHTIGYHSTVVTADFRAALTIPDSPVLKPVRFVFEGGRAAVWRKDDSTKVTSRILYIPSGATFHKAIGGRIMHEVHIPVEGSDEPAIWSLKQLPSGGCGCNKIAAGYSFEQLLNPDFTTIP